MMVDAGEIVPHRTGWGCDRFAPRITASAGENAWTSWKPSVVRTWAAAWERLTVHHLDVDHDNNGIVLDAIFSGSGVG